MDAPSVPTAPSRHAIARDVACFCALMTTALALGAALAHALELPNKIDLSREDYFTVQQVYRGWNLLGLLLLAELVSLVAVATLSRRNPRALRWALGAIGCLLLAQVVFWAFTYPANVATDNWTTMPSDWASLRRQWEYSHLAGAVAQTAAMACISLAALSSARAPAEQRYDGASG